MITPFPTLRRHRHRRPRKLTPAPAPPPVVPLTLDTATYNWEEDPDNPGEGTGILTLGFSRAINIGAVNPAVILVDDSSQAHVRFDATGGTTQLDPLTVQFVLVPIGDPVLMGQRLTAEANNGIVAANDATPWPGCNGIEFT
jgi:hypothetical protein